MSEDGLTARRARLMIVAAAVLWSLSGFFTKVLTKPTPLGLDEPALAPLAMAFFRCFFAAVALAPTLRSGDISFRPLMAFMAITFAVMNASFVWAMAMGTAANAIFLQYSAPMWMYLASVWLLREKADRRNAWSMLIGLAGVGVILVGGWQDSQMLVVGIALLSGITYAAIVGFLRALRAASSRWLTVLNPIVGALALLPFVIGITQPSWGQLATLLLYGSVQLAMPYLLMAHALKRVSPQEAGTITLLEPVLNPVWAYLIAGEQPSPWTLAGGCLILGALAWRYGLASRQEKDPST